MFDASSIIAGLVISSIGYIFFSYGRRMSRPPQMIGGLLLMIFPYFIPSAPVALAVGGVLCGLIWLATHAGY